ncbi:MAG: hypothetical protein CM15mP84_09610 [Cellvibrionales bacterium]|nr:MAG: hypothetical protein CM15mP84_09610 [Cellvibrionales bacterium]
MRKSAADSCCPPNQGGGEVFLRHRQIAGHARLNEQLVQPLCVEFDEGFMKKGRRFCEIVVTVFISCKAS